MIRPDLIAPSRVSGDRSTLRGIGEAIRWSDLTTGETPFAQPAAVLEIGRTLKFVQVTGARRDGAARGEREVSALSREDLTGLAAARSPAAYLLARTEGKAVVGVGTSPRQIGRLDRRLQARLGGPRSRTLDPRGMLRAAREWACLLGMPGESSASFTAGALADSLLDAFREEELCVLVLGTVAPSRIVQGLLSTARQTAEEIERVHLQLGQQVNVNRAALRVRDLLDRTALHLESGLTGQLWQVAVLVGAATAEAAQFGAGVIAGALRENRPEADLVPLRPFGCRRDDRGLPVQINLLDPARLSTLCSLPGRDRAGFGRVWDTDFDVDHSSSAEGLRLGPILDRGHPTKLQMTLGLDVLTRHTLVVGHTGAGKTTTVQRLLSDLSARGLPFLVLEPAKREYATLRERVPDLRVYSFASADAKDRTPLLLNPFAFPEGFPVHTHIDFVKASFISSFGLLPPAPYLLESALYEAYRRRGWDLSAGTSPLGHDPLAFPTLGDLIAAAEDVVAQAGYDAELTRNLSSALRTRIGNLTLGPKGASLDTPWALPDAELWEKPAVVELAGLGSDEEKALLMGFLLTRLFEYREIHQPADSKTELRHLLVIEEAHRLLRKTPERSSEEGNMAHQAIQTFANLLAELRAYGQGVLCVDQIPNNLASEAVKLAGTKIVHRLLPEDDRRAVGSAMALSQVQQRALVSLGVGEAVCHTEGMDGAARVSVDALSTSVGDTRARPDSRPSSLIEVFRARAPFRQALTSEAIVRPADGVLALALARLDFDDPLQLLRDSVSRNLPGSLEGGSPDLRSKPLEAFALEDAILRRIVANRRSSIEYRRLCEALVGEGLRAVATELRELLGSSPGPSGGCENCPAPCSWRYEAMRLLGDRILEEDLIDIVQNDRGTATIALQRACERRLAAAELATEPALQVCVVSHFGRRWGLSTEARKNLQVLFPRSPSESTKPDGQHRRQGESGR